VSLPTGRYPACARASWKKAYRQPLCSVGSFTPSECRGAWADPAVDYLCNGEWLLKDSFVDDFWEKRRARMR
jgi:hypothetical protein